MNIEEIKEKYGWERDSQIDWNYISKNQVLSEDIIREYADKLNWKWISTRINLSDEFIEKHAEKLDWGIMSRYRVFSEEFMLKFADYMDWERILKDQNPSIELIIKHWNNFSPYKEILIEKFGLTNAGLKELVTKNNAISKDSKSSDINTLINNTAKELSAKKYIDYDDHTFEEQTL